MAKQYASLRNLRFLLHEVHQVSDLTQSDYFAHLDKESLDFMLETAFQVADTHLFPYFAEMDRQEPEHHPNGSVTIHPKAKAVLEAMAEGGWLNSNTPLDKGGMQLPEVMVAATNFVFQAANNGIMGLPGLTTGAARLILSFGSEAQQRTFMDPMFAGQWQGTMALTEPQAGSSLSDVLTSAEPVGDGVYKIKGQKIFISAGDSDAVDNVVHLLLARIKGAPAGTKGISLFIVPKKRPSDGKLVANDVQTAGIFHKMGQKTSPACHLVFGEKDDCHGYLVGEANRGLSYMFQMMNEARILVGATSAGIASAAYCASLEYAKERPQGRRLNEKDPLQAPTLIINHPDVKRMLLFQKAVTEGALSLLLECAKYADLAHVSEGAAKDDYNLLLDLLVPVAKTYPSEAGIASVSAAMQCLGGYGYCKDFPIEQLYRDIRITAIYEGTTGIQSLDLLGRKFTMQQGRAAMLFLREVAQAMEAAAVYDELKRYALALDEELKTLQKVTRHLMGFALQGDQERFLADANLFMELFSLVAVGWQWLKQGTEAKKALLVGGHSQEDLHFYESKLLAMQYFFHYEIPKTQGLATRLLDPEVLTIARETEVLV
jgi:alkylation response protein AidB-like acyl-CoA dehydrogenase